MVVHKKGLPDGTIREWTPSKKAIKEALSWSKSRINKIYDHVEGMAEHYPQFYTVLGGSIDDRDNYGGGQPKICLHCNSGHIVFYEEGPGCLNCGKLQPFVGKFLGWIGSVVVPLSNRPSLKRFKKVIKSHVLEERVELQRHFITVDGEPFLKVPTEIYLGSFGGEPRTLFTRSYFILMGIPSNTSDSHVWREFFPHNRVQLCLHRNWKAKPIHRVITDRVIPRIYIELTLTDLKESGYLSRALDRLGMDEHNFYNECSVDPEILKQVYKRCVKKESRK